ncbi:3bddf667-08fd-4d35-a5c1-21dc64e001ad [Sclerotinia trifoliorum]|uniref:3bddf667-08fd-4d35-a5c1-21dc64e001ad n=1 Tax=Sclerotinia trifoliorum TaxID=28548 RepID=A0A8H2VL46_9HELO|nr:3bddf667-08fd-4d35-a5c1-21dc64e001ad [Sclerotinia trifoliorum]
MERSVFLAPKCAAFSGYLALSPKLWILTIQYLYNRNPGSSFLSIPTMMNASRPNIVSSNDKLPITIFDSPALQGYNSGTTRQRRDSLRLAIQCLAVVILLNILLHKAVQFSSAKIQRAHYCSHGNGTLAPSRFENEDKKYPTALGSESDNVEDRHLSGWLLAAVLKPERHQYPSNPIM